MNTHRRAEYRKYPRAGVGYKELTQLLEVLGIEPQETGERIRITGEDPIVASPHRITTVTSRS